MRLWSFHPMYLDDDSLYLTWKKGMIAVRALTGKLHGYERMYANHRQLVRFQAQPDPVQAISDYMHTLADDAERRGWHYPRYFKHTTLPRRRDGTHMSVTAGQMEYEIWRYAAILSSRGGMINEWERFFGVDPHLPNPIFEMVRGPIGSWERYG